MRNNPKRVLMVVPFGAAAGVLLIASAAFACTAWIGQFKVTGDNTPSNTVVSDGRGSRTSFSMTQCVSGPVTQAQDTGGSVTIWTGTSVQDANCNNDPDAADRRLPECGSSDDDLTCTGSNKRVYEVNFYNSTYSVILPDEPGYADHDSWAQDCMSGFLPTIVKLGEVTVDSNGNIDSATGGTYDSTARTASFGLPNGLTLDQSPAESAVCVSDSVAFYGNQAPLTIA